MIWAYPCHTSWWLWALAFNRVAVYTAVCTRVPSRYIRCSWIDLKSLYTLGSQLAPVGNHEGILATQLLSTQQFTFELFCRQQLHLTGILTIDIDYLSTCLWQCKMSCHKWFSFLPYSNPRENNFGLKIPPRIGRLNSQQRATGERNQAPKTRSWWTNTTW